MDKAFASVALKNAAAFGRVRDGIARVVEKLHRAGFRRTEVDRAAFTRGLQFHDVALQRIEAREEFTLLLGEVDEALVLIERDFDGLAFAAHREARAVVVTRPLERRFLVGDGRAAGKHEPSHKKGHPAKQTFQAIRIEVNQEEEALKRLLEVGPNLLNEDGRMAIITFMSLDDRLVKRRFHSLCVEEGSRHDIRLPERKEFALLTKKPILPSDKELLENPRSASAKLRGIRKKKEEEQ